MAFPRDDIEQRTSCPACGKQEAFVNWLQGASGGEVMWRSFWDAFGPVKAARYLVESMLASETLNSDSSRQGAARVRKCNSCGQYGYRCPLCRESIKLASYPKEAVPKVVCGKCECLVYIEKP